MPSATWRTDRPIKVSNIITSSLRFIAKVHYFYTSVCIRHAFGLKHFFLTDFLIRVSSFKLYQFYVQPTDTTNNNMLDLREDH